MFVLLCLVARLFDVRKSHSIQFGLCDNFMLPGQTECGSF